MSDRLKRKQEFIHALAEFFGRNQARRSIELQMGQESAKEWAELRSHTPIFGYPTIEEIEATLSEFLG